MGVRNWLGGIIYSTLIIEILCCLVFLLRPIHAQQPQTQSAPNYDVNAQYVNGVAPGYAPTAGSGLTLNLSAGSIVCSGTPVAYAGGTLTMTNSATNYVELNVSSSCIPSSNTTAFTAGNSPIAKVTASGGVITVIVDYRPMGVATPASVGTATNGYIYKGTLSISGTISSASSTNFQVAVAGATASGATPTVCTGSFNADFTSIIGFAPSTNGGLFIGSYPTTGYCNFTVVNDTGAPININSGGSIQINVVAF